MAQSDIAARSGLLRCYISRVEHCHTVPNIETLEKFARALEVPLYQMFYDGDQPLPPPALVMLAGRDDFRGQRGKIGTLFRKLTQALAQMESADRRLLLSVAQKMIQVRGSKNGNGRAKLNGSHA